MVSSTTTVWGQLCSVFASFIYKQIAAKVFNLGAQEHVFLDISFIFSTLTREKSLGIYICCIFSCVQQNLTSFSLSSLLVQRLCTSFWTRILVIVSKVNTSKENLTMVSLYTWQNEIAKKLDKENFLILNQLQQPSSCGDGVRAQSCVKSGVGWGRKLKIMVERGTANQQTHRLKLIILKSLFLGADFLALREEIILIIFFSLFFCLEQLSLIPHTRS